MNGTGARNPWLIAPVVAIAAFMEVLDISIANVALQHIAGDLGSGRSESTWILTSYLVTNAIVLPLSGWLSAVMGRTRFFTACILGFSLSSLLCGLAPNLPTLIVFRAIQGLTGGGLQPSAQAILNDTFPPSKRGMAFALYGVSVVFAPAIGPTLGGWLTDTASWRWVFLINVPIGILLVPLVTAMVEDPPHAVAERLERWKRGIRIDSVGFALLVAGLGCLQVMLDKGDENDWFGSPMIIALAGVSLVSLVAFVIWELGQEDPIVDLRLLADRNFGTANLLMFMLGAILLGSTVLLPLMVQEQFGYTATQAGLVITPGGFAIMLAMPLVGRLVSTVDPRFLIVGGLLIGALSLHMMAGFTAETGYASFMWTRIVQGMGMALLFIPINTIAFIGLPREKSSQGSAIINLARNLGGSVGISATVTLLSRFSQEHQTVLAGHVTPTSPAYREMAASLAATMARHGTEASAALRQAQATIYDMVGAQAQLMGFLDDFRLLAAIFAALAPLVFLMRRPQAAHH
jgi:DHA2 family multidrug resistance protein